MENWRKIDKERLTIFTDAIMAIIMTILVLDLKVPIGEFENDADLKRQLVKQLPHFWGFAISFAMIVVLWFSHHNLMKSLNYSNTTFAVLNFIFTGSIATLPFSTALVSEYPTSSTAVSILAFNMLVMNVFLAGMFTYLYAKKLGNPDVFPPWYLKVKRALGMGGGLVFLAAIFVAFASPTVALWMIAAVPFLHMLPVRQKYF